MQNPKSLNKRILEDCDSVECFWVNYGSVVHNLTELINAINEMKHITFRYHVNQNHNDILRNLKVAVSY